ncbi:protein RD3-like [Chanos chanos]|uniref:Protein RD3-like n=1 Tax=Chanos chanos TaxID=29144 RepID=A0A6J2V8C3_CHACN|nr:protein RD3-like [Chanos chanos]
MPLFGWMRWPRVESNEAMYCMAPGCPGESGQVLLRELLWQLEQREHLALEEELQHHLSQGTLGNQYSIGPPGLPPLMSASERRQLERLCSRVPPSHTAIVLSRFREVLATNDVLPWELVCVFKRVLRDFLRRLEEEMQSLPPVTLTLPPLSLPEKSYACGPKTKRASTLPVFPKSQGIPREEIPTISSYVDRHLRTACSYSNRRDGSLPYFQPASYACSGTYSTTL